MRVSIPRLTALALAVLAPLATGCGGGDEPASDEDRASEVAEQYVHTNANNEDAKCRETLARGSSPKLCGDGAPLATRVNPDTKEAEVTGSNAKVTVTGAATALLDITLVKEDGEWKVKGWRGYAPGQ